MKLSTKFCPKSLKVLISQNDIYIIYMISIKWYL